MPYSLGEARTCPRCAAHVEPGELVCPRCALPLSDAPSAPPDPRGPNLFPVRDPAPAGASYDPLRLAVALVAAAILAVAGWQMLGIRSVGSLSGEGTIFEPFFGAVGVMSFGLAVLSVAVGLRRA